MFSCKQKDETAPKIYINGDNPQRIILESYYDDEGASADDNFDGPEISSKMTISYDISGLPSGITDWKNLEGWTNRSGTYTVTYTVTDNAGLSTSVDRIVEVYNEADKFAVPYYVTKTASNEQNGSIADFADVTINVSADSKKNNRILFPKLSGISGLKIYGDIRDSVIVSGTDTIIRKYIDIPAQTKRLTIGSEVIDFDVQGIPDQSFFTDTLFFYNFRISYNIDKTDTLGNWLYSGDAVEIYEKI